MGKSSASNRVDLQYTCENYQGIHIAKFFVEKVTHTMLPSNAMFICPQYMITDKKFNNWVLL
jgi:hypothetical protein